MKLWNRDSPLVLIDKADGLNPKPHWGIQKLPDSKWNWGYGYGRIRLQNGPHGEDRGLYLHGANEDNPLTTSGCICDRTEAIFNYFWNSNYQKNVPISVQK